MSRPLAPYKVRELKEWVFGTDDYASLQMYACGYRAVREATETLPDSPVRMTLREVTDRKAELLSMQRLYLTKVRKLGFIVFENDYRQLDEVILGGEDLPWTVDRDQGTDI